MNYYNEIDPGKAEWIRNLIKEGIIANGIIDERRIEDVKPIELAGFTQCHFFAGIGVWSYALRQAGWPDDRPVWTGSCPCQPFSAAGKGAGFDDERHLWPAWFWLIEQCAPTVVFGEQVASKATGPWFDLVQADVEALGFAFGCVAFPAASVGAPHIRERAYWVANRNGARLEQGCSSIWLGDAGSQSRERDAGGICGAEGEGASSWSSDGRFHNGYSDAGDASNPGPVNSFWRAADWIGCRDNKWRPVEPGTFPLADGPSARVLRVRAYGDAIVAPAAREFIGSYLEVVG